jgi:2-keto-4-pentenoate hydratase/2-oxohepta-3-ene-1,7-dioic acid hydratase in catechol pathway
MRLVTFRDDAGERIGVLDGEVVRDVTAADGEWPDSMLALIAGGPSVLNRVRGAAGAAPSLPVSTVSLCAPIPRPAKNIFCVGKNYREHAQEFQVSGFDATATVDAIPEAPIIFTKPATCVIGPGAAIAASLDPTASVDYENEFAVIIGAGGRAIPAERWAEHVFGYTIVNDVTARLLQQRHKQWFLGKGIDTFCPMGPCIVTADELSEPASARLRTWVNGDLRQDATVRDLIFDIPTLIATISRAITLEPGDIIATGTPSGVGIGFKPPRYLRPGDIVLTAIEPIGSLSNPVI